MAHAITYAFELKFSKQRPVTCNLERTILIISNKLRIFSLCTLCKRNCLSHLLPRDCETWTSERGEYSLDLKKSMGPTVAIIFMYTEIDKADLLCRGTGSFYIVLTWAFRLTFYQSTRVKMFAEKIKKEENPEPAYQAHSALGERSIDGTKPPESAHNLTENLVYDHDDEEPEIHARTYLAVAAMFLLNMVQVVALQGPPAVVSYYCEGTAQPALRELTGFSFLTLVTISTAQPRRPGYPMPSPLFRQWCLPPSPPFQIHSKSESSY
jgi:hypothetical protein